MQTIHAQNPQELLEKLEMIATLSWVALPGFELLVDQPHGRIAPPKQFEISLRHHGPTTITPLLERLKAPDDSKDFQAIKSSLITMLMRATVADAFEAIRTYCEDRGHTDYLKSKKWYHFARVVRNTYSHGGTLTIRKRKKLKDEEKEKRKILDSEWNGKRFNESMFGHPIPLDFFDFDDAQLFIDDMSRFCNELEKREKQDNE